ncbi:cadherin-like domain-containing protein, partial [Aquabacterium lacunae]|uniref:cadherin-like domain-containing protein n=1 Tax=Aquabacterium lacunae TaxID=2528630 RepID=UPI0013EF198C
TVSLVLDPATNKPVLSFTPAANFNGDVSFTYTVTDGTTEVSPTVSVSVKPVSDTPEGADVTRATQEDVPYVVKGEDLGLTDVDGDALKAVRIDTLPTDGSLQLNGVPVTAGQVISAADLAAGKL